MYLISSSPPSAVSEADACAEAAPISPVPGTLYGELMLDPTIVGAVIVAFEFKIPHAVIPDNTVPVEVTSNFVPPPYCNCRFPVADDT